jgi:DNA-binding transcriptional ArsR family regulator
MNYERSLVALADPTRRAVFERLRAGPASVGELAAGLPVSRPAVSQHLKVLKDARLVRDEAVGTRRLYQLDPEGLGQLRSWIDQFWTDSLLALKAEVERGD